MKLNETQIQKLYAFTRQHFVEHYDLQTELVDHLANDIEAIWDEQPELSFEDARDQSFGKFGVYGFMEVVEERQKAMGKRYRKYLWCYFKQWFELPQLLITIFIFIGFYAAFSSRLADVFYMSSFILLAIWSFYRGLQLKKEFERRKEETKRKWLLEEIIFKQASAVGLLLISQVFNVNNLSNGALIDNMGIIVISMIFTLAVLFSYVSFFVLPNEAENLLEKTYPEYNL